MVKQRLMIALADGGNPANKGDAACYLGSLKVVKKAFPNEEILYFSDDPEKAEDEFRVFPVFYSKFACPYTGFSLVLPHNKIRLACRAFRTLLWFLTNCIGFLNPYEKWNFLIKRQCDVYVSKCGGNINDHYWSSMYYNLLWYWLLKREGKKVIILAQSVNPIRNPVYRFLLRLVLNRLDLITVREPHSIKALNDLAVDMKKVHLTSDLALLVNENDVPFKIEKPAVCISVRYWKWSKNQSEYVNAIISIANSLVAMGYHVYFLSTGWTEPYSDRWFASQFLSQIPSARIIKDEPSLGKLRRTLREFDLVVATRMHMTVLAMSQFVPCVAICYEEKAHGLFELLGLEDYALDLEDIDVFNLYRAVGSALLYGHQISGLLKENVPKLQERALENVALLRGAVYG